MRLHGLLLKLHLAEQGCRLLGRAVADDLFQLFVAECEVRLRIGTLYAIERCLACHRVSRLSGSLLDGHLGRLGGDRALSGDLQRSRLRLGKTL